jgi:type II restriction/modification system DNA methylase subunit YeeA
MTFAEFKKKWSRYQGKETSAYQGHFDDLCRVLGQPTPAEADPSGRDFFCYQKRVLKNAELFDFDESSDAGGPTERGFADVWKKGFFAWEYKGKKKNLDEAYRQLLRYRESLLNPPLLVVCDFDRYIIKTNFNGTVQEVHEFTSRQIDDPKIIRLLHNVFTNPDYLRPLRTTARVTEELADKIAAVASSLQGRESVELADAFTRRELHVAQKKNLRIARFLNRIVFCFFAEDTGLLPKNLFAEIAREGLEDKQHFNESLEQLFRVMAKGGRFGKDKIRHFNGHLFEDATVFELTDTEIRWLAEAAESDWQFIEPAIMGTLFERALDGEGNLRAQLGAHYTCEADIKTIVEPVLMAPLRQEWSALREEVREIHVSMLNNLRKPGQKLSGAAKGSKRLNSTLLYNLLNKFVERLAEIRVLDPACGSGNFLYVSLQLLLGLEKEVISFGTEIDVPVEARVSVKQLSAIEINPHAFELAQVSVQIGYLQWRRDNGFDNDRTPVLQVLDGFQNEDALLVPHFRSKAKSLKEAQAGEHNGDDALKFYTEREWPKCDVIVSNPPFLGGKLLRRELGDAYVEALFQNFANRVKQEADLCCYWFEKARQQIEDAKCRRAGLLATQGIRGGANREVLKRVKDTGDIFFAESDREWVLAGANVHVSMIGFDKGLEKVRILNGRPERLINANLSASADVTVAKELKANLEVAFMGTTKGGAFDIPENFALKVLRAPNPHDRPNSDIVAPWVNGIDLTQRPSGTWIIDFGVGLSAAKAAHYEFPFKHLRTHVKPVREQNKRESYRRLWWQHVEARPAMRKALASLKRFLVTTTVSKHRVFAWLSPPTLPDHQLVAFGRADDYFLGILHSRFHEIWALKQGTRLETRPRYTPTTCFETFPFPFRDDLQALAPPHAKPPPKPKQPQPDRTYAEHLAAKNYFYGKEDSPPYRVRETPDEDRAAVAAAAKELNEFRERWLNPPEWTVEKILEFPGSINGPWARYVVKPDQNGIGTVRYPRLEPRDADCAAKLKERTLTKLYNEHPDWLKFAHQNLDAAVAAAYGWPVDLTDEQILEKLLALNLERAGEEAKVAKMQRPKAFREKTADEML